MERAPLLTSGGGHPPPTSCAAPSHPLSSGEKPTFAPCKEGHTASSSLLPWLGKPGAPHSRPTGLHTHTPEDALVPPSPSGNQTSAQDRVSCSEAASPIHGTPPPAAGTAVRLSPASDLAQWTLNSQPTGAATRNVCLQGQPQDICLPKGGRPSPRGPRARQAGVSGRETGLVGAGLVSQSTAAAQGHLSRHTRESLGEKEEHTQVHQCVKGRSGCA